MLEAAVLGGSPEGSDDSEAECEEEDDDDDDEINVGFRVKRLDYCPVLLHTKLNITDEGVYTLKHLVTGETVPLAVGKEFDIKFSVGAWRVTELGSESLGRPLPHFFNKELRVNESTNFIDIFQKRENLREGSGPRLWRALRGT